MMKYNLLVFVSVNNSQPKPILTELCGRAGRLDTNGVGSIPDSGVLKEGTAKVLFSPNIAREQLTESNSMNKFTPH